MKTINICVLIFGLIAYCSCDSKKPETTAPEQPVQLSQAPAFTLNDISTGQEVTLTSLMGTKPVILDFWASWCPPCRELMPKLQEFYQSNKATVNIVGISGDNTLDAAKSFVTKNNITFSILFDSTKEVFRKYQIVGIPTTVVLNTKGEIVRQGHFSIEELKEIVKSVW